MLLSIHGATKEALDWEQDWSIKLETYFAPSTVWNCTAKRCVRITIIKIC